MLILTAESYILMLGKRAIEEKTVRKTDSRNLIRFEFPHRLRRRQQLKHIFMSYEHLGEENCGVVITKQCVQDGVTQQDGILMAFYSLE